MKYFILMYAMLMTTLAQPGFPLVSESKTFGEVAEVDINPGTMSSNPSEFTPFGGQLFFSAFGPNGSELYAYGPTKEPIGMTLPEIRGLMATIS